MEKYIESSQNKIIKEINSLKNKKDRDKNKLFILEGQRLISEAEKSIINYIVISESYIGEKPQCDSTYIVPDALFNKISDTVNPQGILAVCTIKESDISELSLNNNPLLIVLENVTDPGNMGTIIRTADAAGADAVILTKGCVDIYNSKVIRATMGSIFHLPIYRNANGCEIIDKLNNSNIITLCAHLKGNTTPYNVNMTKGVAIIIGNEAKGLSDEISDKASTLVKIPMLGKAESMNAGIAAGILIYEAVRQRLVQG